MGLEEHSYNEAHNIIYGKAFRGRCIKPSKEFIGRIFWKGYDDIRDNMFRLKRKHFLVFKS